jgi:hypothetical protein
MWRGPTLPENFGQSESVGNVDAVYRQDNVTLSSTRTQYEPIQQSISTMVSALDWARPCAARSTLRIDGDDHDLQETHRRHSGSCVHHRPQPRAYRRLTAVLLGTPLSSRIDCGSGQSYRTAQPSEQNTRLTQSEAKPSLILSQHEMRGGSAPARRRPAMRGTAPFVV